MSPVTPLSPRDPRRVGEYSLRGRVGEGGQGRVYLGETPDGTQVAVKIFHHDLLGDTDARVRLDREVQAAQQVARFCTAQLIDAQLREDPPYIVSEYVDGPPLRRVVESDGPLAGAALERLAVSTATALAAIHEAGIVHRDFKPGNVLMGPDGPRVIDFGIARALQATTASTAVAGTPGYMAPEQFLGTGVGPPADVFSWGATIVYAATGRPAFGGDTVAAIMYRILHGAPDLGTLPDPLRSIVGRCMARDPQARPTARDLMLELVGGGSGNATTRPLAPPYSAAQHPYPAVTAPRRPGGARWIWVAALAALVVLLGGVATWAALKQGDGGVPSAGPTANATGQVDDIPARFAGTWFGYDASSGTIVGDEDEEEYPPVHTIVVDIRAGKVKPYLQIAGECSKGVVARVKGEDLSLGPGCDMDSATFSLDGQDATLSCRPNCGSKKGSAPMRKDALGGKVPESIAGSWQGRFDYADPELDPEPHCQYSMALELEGGSVAGSASYSYTDDKTRKPDKSRADLEVLGGTESEIYFKSQRLGDWCPAGVIRAIPKDAGTLELSVARGSTFEPIGALNRR